MMWADVDTKSDFLNYSEVAELALDVLRDRKMLPVSIGVFGTWGTGKSTLLNLIEKELTSGEGKEFIVIRFDAWMYQGFDDARAALMDVIGARLLAEVEREQNVGLWNKTKNLTRRIDYIRGAGLLADAGAAFMGLPTLGFLSKGAGAISDLVSGDGDPDDAQALRESAKEAADKGMGLLKAKEKRSPPQEIDAFRREFKEILNELGRTLVVFVDNLDRCLPKQAIHTLEALRLFLFMDRTAFVVAADEDMVRHSVTRFFSDLDDRHVRDYLDKLIQVPIRLPKLGTQEIRAYLMMLFASAAEPEVPSSLLETLRVSLEDNLRRAWEAKPLKTAAALSLLGATATSELGKALDAADRLAAVLATTTAVNGNPRIVKRLLNVIRMRVRVAMRRKMPLDEALIAKLALFERCTGEAATAELYRLVQEAIDGKPELVRKLEELVDDEQAFQETVPPSWKKDVGFIREWCRLEPRLGDISLTAAAYLAREMTVMASAGKRLSADGIRAVQTLVKLPSMTSQAAGKVIASTPADERALVMEALLSDMRKRLPWDGKPDALFGAILLADAAPETGAALMGLIKSAYPGKLPVSIAPLVDKRSWWKKDGA